MVDFSNCSATVNNALDVPNQYTNVTSNDASECNANRDVHTRKGTKKRFGRTLVKSIYCSNASLADFMRF